MVSYIIILILHIHIASKDYAMPSKRLKKTKTKKHTCSNRTFLFSIVGLRFDRTKFMLVKLLNVELSLGVCLLVNLPRF